MKELNVACIGSRSWNDYFFILGQLEFRQQLVWKNCKVTIISGGAEGADKMAAKAARMLGYPVVEFKPDYELFGSRAPLVRNEDIIKECDQVLAFWDLKSTGTLHALKIAKSLKKPITIFVK